MTHTTEKQYTITRGARGVTAIVHERLGPNCRMERLLLPRRDLWNHSPDGFEIGYSGSGSTQLALALLADALEDDDLAVEWHQEFKWRTVARWREEEHTITAETIRDIVADLRATVVWPDPFEEEAMPPLAETDEP